MDISALKPLILFGLSLFNHVLPLLHSYASWFLTDQVVISRFKFSLNAEEKLYNYFYHWLKIEWL